MRYVPAIFLGLLVTRLCFGNDLGTDYGAKLSELEKQTGGRIGVATIDSSRNKGVEYRAYERFLLCSTFKALAVAAVLKRVDEKKEQLDRFVTYGEAQLLEYAPVTRAQVKE